MTLPSAHEGCEHSPEYYSHGQGSEQMTGMHCKKCGLDLSNVALAPTAPQPKKCPKCGGQLPNESISGRAALMCSCNSKSAASAPQQKVSDWEGELQFGIMEDYLDDAKYRLDDSTKPNIMVNHYEKLKDFIRSERTKAYESGYEFRDKEYAETLNGVIKKAYEEGQMSKLPSTLESLDLFELGKRTGAKEARTTLLTTLIARAGKLEKSPTLCGGCNLNGDLCERCYSNRQVNAALNTLIAEMEALRDK